MRGLDERSGELFSYVDLERRVPARHPLRAIRTIVNEALATLDEEFEAIYASTGRPSIPPEKLDTSKNRIIFALAGNESGVPRSVAA